MNRIPSQISSGRLQKPPVASLVVSDVRLHLVLHLPISDEHAFDPRYLGTRETRTNMNIYIRRSHAFQLSPDKDS